MFKREIQHEYLYDILSTYTFLKALCHDISGDCYYFRSSIRTCVVTNRTHTKILSFTPHGLQNAIEGQGKDLATRGAAR